jgi:Tfp pilus assembly PilM family ATPase/Tfp pilus assembly protein PilN
MAAPLNLNTFFHKLLSLLRVRTVIGGLEIGDSALRHMAFIDGTWQMESLRLPPGLVVHGAVQDHAQFVEALKTLKEQILGPVEAKKRLNVVVSLSSINVYSQVFSLPVIEGENLEQAVQLNIQMVSPNEAAQTYSGWQLVGHDERSVRLEILSAFVQRGVIDEMKNALSEAGFVPYSLESRALSLARLARTLVAGFDQAKSYILVNLDTNGIEFLILRRGHLYFQYFTSWQDILGSERQLTQAAFGGLVVKNLHQVLTFYKSHWTDPVTDVLVAASSLRDELTTTIKENFSLMVQEVSLSIAQPISPDWFVALGSGLRGIIPRREDRDISLLGVSAQEEFRRHQTADFLRFWRVLVPATLAVIMVALGGVRIFLGRTDADLKNKLLAATFTSEQSQEMDALKTRIAEFNRVVDILHRVGQGPYIQTIFFESFAPLLAEHGITLTRFSFRGFSDPVTIQASARSEEQILKLKRVLDEHPLFEAVQIPLSDIRQEGQAVSFSMSFRITAPNTE